MFIQFCPLWLVMMTDRKHLDFPRHPMAADLADYYRDYAIDFGLIPHIVFNVVVESIERDHQSSKWLVKVGGEDKPRSFDKVVFAIGTEVVAIWPKIKNMSAFEGDFIHAQQYKR